MSRSRATLHMSKIADFRSFCEGLGWVTEQPKGYHEVLRMRHKDFSEPLIVHARDSAKEHATTWGVSAQMCANYVRAKKERVK